MVAELIDASPYAPLTRLGRWDGTSLVPVGAGSIDTAQVVVITHGWEPGLREPYERLQAASESLITAWDPQLVDSNGESAMIRFGPFIEALGRAEPEATILMFSWIDQSATAADLFDARVGEDATEINGHRLAVAVDQAVADDWSGELHIIGHSFGANVATTAALAVDQRPRQLTLFDSPDDGLTRLGGAANDLRYKLPRLDLGREASQTFVDNYISEVGIRYGDLPGLRSVVDVRLSPPDELNFSQSHQYPIVWWTDALAVGRSTPPAGPWWSPLLGGDPASVGAYYEAEDAEDPLALTELDRCPVAGGRRRRADAGRPARPGVGHEARRRRSVAGRGSGLRDHRGLAAPGVRRRVRRRRGWRDPHAGGRRTRALHSRRTGGRGRRAGGVRAAVGRSSPAITR